MGGGFMHRVQPFMWAELTRYGLDVVENPDERAFHRRDQGVEESGPASFDALLASIDLLCADARTLVPDPWRSSGEAALRGRWLGACRRSSVGWQLPSAELERLDALCSGLMSAPNDRAGFLSRGLRARRLRRRPDARGERRWTIAGGTQALVAASPATSTVTSARGRRSRAVAGRRWRHAPSYPGRRDGGGRDRGGPTEHARGDLVRPKARTPEGGGGRAGSAGLGVKVWATLGATTRSRSRRRRIGSDVRADGTWGRERASAGPRVRPVRRAAPRRRPRGRRRRDRRHAAGGRRRRGRRATGARPVLAGHVGRLRSRHLAPLGVGAPSGRRAGSRSRARTSLVAGARTWMGRSRPGSGPPTGSAMS